VILELGTTPVVPQIRKWLRGVDLNHRPLGYEPNELPDCSTPHFDHNQWLRHRQTPLPVMVPHFLSGSSSGRTARIQASVLGIERSRDSRHGRIQHDQEFQR
jgi:hypothetical protein